MHLTRVEESLDLQQDKNDRLCSNCQGLIDQPQTSADKSSNDTTPSNRDAKFEDSLIRAARRPTENECNMISVISLLDDNKNDDKNDASSLTTTYERSRPDSIPLSSEHWVLDLNQEEDVIFGEYGRELELASRPTLPDGPARISTEILRRNPSVTYPLEIIDSWSFKSNLKIRSGVTVGLENGDFLLVTKIIRHGFTKAVFFRGLRLQRTRNMNGLLPSKLNELCWVIEVDQDDPRKVNEQSATEVPATEIRSIRRLRITNKEFPLCSFRDQEMPDDGLNDVSLMQDEGPLVLRWRYVCTYATARHRLNNSYLERSLEHLRKEHLLELGQTDYGIRDGRKRVNWRGGTISGGAYMDSTSSSRKRGHEQNSTSTQDSTPKRTRFSNYSRASDSPSPSLDASDRLDKKRTKKTAGGTAESAGAESIDLTEEDSGPPTNITLAPRTNRSIFPVTPTKSPAHTRISSQTPTNSVKAFRQDINQKYNYGDSFCGAGGATRGAYNAGFQVVWGNDFDEFAGASWRKNFPESIFHGMSADELIRMSKIPGQEERMMAQLRVDVLHLSPPCQYFSPAHTCPGKNDEVNSASLFACGELVDLAKPRLITLEQTFGLMHARFRQYLNSLLRMFAERGFSVRWKAVPLQNWGLPQRRLRLIVIGACPGEVLPDFPPFTHAENGEGGLKKFNSVNSAIQSIPYHAKDHDIENARPRTSPPWDGNTIAPRCITTSGGQNYHPSGKRDFTNREFAAIQGFPQHHQFCGSYVVKQIGNAFPSSVVEVLYRHLLKALRKADGIQTEVISID